MNTSESIKEISAALVNFHKIVGKIAKGEKNPFFKSKYASLSNILDSIHEPLNQCGLVVMQFPDNEGLLTRLQHESGEYMEATYIMPVAKQNDPQALGSAITYARRYAIGAILCLNIDEDDDGNRASNRTATRPEAPKKTSTIDKLKEAIKKPDMPDNVKSIYSYLIDSKDETLISSTLSRLRNKEEPQAVLDSLTPNF